MNRNTSPAPRAMLTLSVPFHLRQLVAADADRYQSTLSAVVAALIARHYGVTVDVKPAAKKAAVRP